MGISSTGKAPVQRWQWRVIDALYGKTGVEYVVPLHRMMNSKDLYAQVDGERCALRDSFDHCDAGVHGTGRHGRDYKVALRELEGSYDNGKRPSQIVDCLLLPSRPRHGHRRNEKPPVMTKLPEQGRGCAHPQCPLRHRVTVMHPPRAMREWEVTVMLVIKSVNHLGRYEAPD